MKKTLLTVVAAIMALCMFAGMDFAESAEGMTFAAITLQEDQFIVMLNAGMVAACKAYGANAVSAMSNGDQEKERTLLDTYGTQEVNGICIMPASNISSPQTLKNCWNDCKIPISVADGEIEQECMPTVKREGALMKISDIIEKIVAYHPPVDPETTCDGVKYGDPDKACTGIVLTCCATAPKSRLSTRTRTSNPSAGPSSGDSIEGT